MTEPTTQPLNLDEIETRWAPVPKRERPALTVTGSSSPGVLLAALAHAPADVAAMAAEIRRLRADAAAELLPAWEAVYEPGNVSDYLIGYTNDECAAKAAAEAWLRSQKDEVGRLEWVPEEQLATGRYDRWFELVEHHDDGIPTGPGLIVRRRAATTEAHVVADDSSDPEHIDDCPDCAPERP